MTVVRRLLLAAAAVVMMGEADDRQPLAVIHGAETEFTENTDPSEISMGLEKALYYPLLRPHVIAETTGN